jgi:hypothetical protein
MSADPLHLRPFESDLKVARACAHVATPTIERSLNWVSSLADERAMLVIAAAIWLASRYCKRGEDREEADTSLRTCYSSRRDGAVGCPTCSKSLRQFVWPTMFCLASTRTLILAHYPSDVAAGLGIGLATNKAVKATLRRWLIWLAAGRGQKLKNVVEPMDVAPSEVGSQNPES